MMSFIKSLIRQADRQTDGRLDKLRQCVFFGTIWPWHLGTQKLYTKRWFAFSSSMQHLFGTPITNLRWDRWRVCRGQLPGGPAVDEETPVASAICWTNLSGHSWRPEGSSPLKHSSTRFAPVQCLLRRINT